MRPPTLTIEVTDALCSRLQDAGERAAFEDALRLLCGWARVAEVRGLDGAWRRGGNGNGRRVVTVEALPEESTEGLTCSLAGG